MPDQSSPVGSPFFSTTFGWVLGETSCAELSAGVGETAAFSTRSATMTRLSWARIPSCERAVEEEPKSSLTVVTAATREPYVAPESSWLNTLLSWSLFGIDSGDPLV